MKVLRTFSLSLLLVIAAAAPAAASTARFTPAHTINGPDSGDREPSFLSVRGGSEANRIALVKRGKRVVITDRAGIKAGKRCKKLSRKRVSCPRAEGTDVTLGRGDDRVNDGGLGADVDGGPGADRVVASGDMRGATGNDNLSVRKGTRAGSGGDNQVIEGGPGDDKLVGGKNHEVLIGGTGRDTLDGGPGPDQLDGDDDITGALDTDVIEGGTGADVLEWGSRRAAATFDTTDNAPEGADGEGEVVTGVENVESGYGDDRLVGGPEANRFDAGEGRDSVSTGDGDDYFSNDFEIDATVDLGPGSDTVSYSEAFTTEGPPPVRVDLSDAAPDGSAGAEETLTGVENLVGGGENDVLIGDSGPNSINGAEGCDTIQGGGGDDKLVGDSGETRDCADDRLEGGDGNDSLRGGDGADALFGGIGDDVFSSRDDEAEDIDCGDGNDSGRVDTSDRLTGCEPAVAKG
jgi:Ca2+-binding RTX toxin-like protein